MKARMLSCQATLLPNSGFVDRAWTAKSEMDGCVEGAKLHEFMNRALR